MNTSSTPSYQFPKPLLYALICLTASLSFKMFNQLDPDYDLWLHLFMGKQTLLHGLIETADRYSFTAFGHPVVNHEWAAQAIMAVFSMVGGQAGLIIWQWIMTLVIVGLVLRLIFAMTFDGFSRITVFLCAAVVLSRGISFRVHLFSYVFLLILINLIYSQAKWKSIPSLCLISLFFMMWANLHGAFVLGLVVWYIHVYFNIMTDSSEKSGRWFTFCLFALPVVMTLANPFSLSLWTYIVYELTNPLKMYITEWQRFDFSSREFPFLVVFMITWSAYFFSGQKKQWVETALLVMVSIMGFLSVRHTPLFAILGLPAMSRHVGAAVNRVLARANKGKSVSAVQVYAATCILVIMSILFLGMGLPLAWQIRAHKDPLPQAAVQYLKKSQLKGNLWTPLHWGGYALYHLYPHIRVSIDGRWATTYPEIVMKDNMLFAYEGTSGIWKRILDQYDANAALIEQDNPAIGEMKNDPEWILLFPGHNAYLLLRADDHVNLRH
jgi:hypothetical protein